MGLSASESEGFLGSACLLVSVCPYPRHIVGTMAMKAEHSSKSQARNRRNRFTHRSCRRSGVTPVRDGSAGWWGVAAFSGRFPGLELIPSSGVTSSAGLLSLLRHING
jgi:hypothetical protein